MLLGGSRSSSNSCAPGNVTFVSLFAAAVGFSGLHRNHPLQSWNHPMPGAELIDVLIPSSSPQTAPCFPPCGLCEMHLQEEASTLCSGGIVLVFWKKNICFKSKNSVAFLLQSYTFLRGSPRCDGLSMAYSK